MKKGLKNFTLLILCALSNLCLSQEKDTLISTPQNLKFWYEYQVNQQDNFANYVDLCDTSTIDTLEKFIPNCIRANVYKTSVNQVYWVQEYYHSNKNKGGYRNGFVKAVRVKRRFCGIPFGTVGCYYQKIGNWKNFIANSTRHEIVAYGSNGPICTGRLPKTYLNIK